MDGLSDLLGTSNFEHLQGKQILYNISLILLLETVADKFNIELFNK